MRYIILILVSSALIFGCKKEPEPEPQPQPEYYCGCTVPCASNYDPNAEYEDGSCVGCSDTGATNYCNQQGNKKADCPGQWYYIGSYFNDDIADDGSCYQEISVTTAFINDLTYWPGGGIILTINGVDFGNILYHQGEITCFGFGNRGKIVDTTWLSSDSAAIYSVDYTIHAECLAYPKSWDTTITVYPDFCNALVFD